MSEPTFAPIYTTYDSVKVRLANKVQFESPEGLQNGELPNALLGQLIVDAETALEQELRSRYAIPFQTVTGGKFATLPDHSKRALRMLVDLKAVMIILATDFGRGTHVSGSSYAKDTKEEYELQIDRALGRDREGANDKVDRFRRSPPLEGVRLARSNSKADDGYHGMILNSDARPDAATYAEEQINNPSRNYGNTVGRFRRGR